MNSKYDRSNSTHLVDDNAFGGIADYVTTRDHTNARVESTDMMPDCLADDGKLVSEGKRIFPKRHEDSEDLDDSDLQRISLSYIGKKGSTFYISKSERIKYAIQIINKELLFRKNTN